MSETKMDAAKAAVAAKREAKAKADAEVERQIEEARRDVPPGIEAEDSATLYAAIANVQVEMPSLKKNSTANLGKFKYKYVTLDEIWAALRPLLTKHGLIVVNTMDGAMLKTSLIHVATGEKIDCAFPIDAKQPPQQLGSAFTYARRYALCALLQIVADNDDDGNAAQGKAAPAENDPF